MLFGRDRGSAIEQDARLQRNRVTPRAEGVGCDR
jgi:hypothetical protein